MLGRLDAARRHAVPDAGLGPARTAGEAVGVAIPERPGAGPNARRRHLLRAMLLAVPGEGRFRPPAGGPRREHVVCGAEPARPAGGRARRPARVGRRGSPTPCQDRSGHHRPVWRQSVGGRPVPLPQRQFSHAPGRRPPPGARVSRPAGRDPSEEPGAIPAGGRTVYRRDPLRRRSGDAERPANLPRHVPGVLQAAARPDVAAGEGTGRRSK